MTRTNDALRAFQQMIVSLDFKKLKMEKIESLKYLIPQTYVDELCVHYRKLDKFLLFPKNNFPISIQDYLIINNGNTEFQVSKFFRNIATLDKFEALIERLDMVFIASEFFQNSIDLKRLNKNALNCKFKERFFYLLAVDSIRSSLDILSKIIAWYYDFENKMDIGFSYKNLIVPLKSYSSILADILKEIYNSKYYKTIKEYRDVEKHVGQGKPTIKFTQKGTTFEINMKRYKEPNFSEIDLSICEILNNLLFVIKNSVKEFAKHSLGYNSKKDVVGIVNSDGTYSMK